MWFLRLYWIFLIFAACSGSSGRVIRVGLDPAWYPMNFGAEQPYVNGFIEDFLMETARYQGIAFERTLASGSALYEGLQTGRYDFVISSLEPYVFNTALYDFSHNILNTGPVLVAPAGVSLKLDEMKSSLVGLLVGDPARLVLETNPTLVLRTYESVPDLLNAVVSGELEAAILDPLRAARYVADLYSGVLCVATGPLTGAGLHAVALKGSEAISLVNKALQRLEKKKILPTLLDKWQLHSST